MNKIVVHLFVVFCIASSGVSARADNDARAKEIAQKMKAQEKGFGDYTADMKMVLIDAGGKEETRRLRIKTREVTTDGNQSIAIFDSPADVKGTAFLSHTHLSSDDDQWLYLPSLKRVKRIAVSNKTAPFMGSEFSYEDLAETVVDKFTYKYIGEDTFEKAPVYIIERFPKDENSGYSKEKVWVEKNRYIPLQIEYYDRHGEKLKTVSNKDYKKYLGKIWFAQEMKMKNHFSGKTSILYWSSFQFQQNLGDIDFNPNRLERAR